jgi:hypothetical protein
MEFGLQHITIIMIIIIIIIVKVGGAEWNGFGDAYGFGLAHSGSVFDKQQDQYVLPGGIGKIH